MSFDEGKVLESDNGRPDPLWEELWVGIGALLLFDVLVAVGFAWLNARVQLEVWYLNLAVFVGFFICDFAVAWMAVSVAKQVQYKKLASSSGAAWLAIPNIVILMLAIMLASGIMTQLGLLP